MTVNPNELGTEQPVATPPPAGSTPPAGDPPALFKKAGGDWGKANESYFNAVGELNTTKNVLGKAAERIQQLEAALGALSGNAAPAGADADPLSALQSELGLDPAPFRKAIAAEVTRTLEGLFTPIVNTMAVEEKLSAEIPNFEQLKGEARKFMQANKEVADTFNAVRQSSPEAAWKYAIRESLIARGAPAPTSPTHASLPNGAAPANRGPETGGPTQPEKVKGALDYFRAYGDDTPYIHERFKGTSIDKAVQEAAQRAGLLPTGEGVNSRW